MKRTLLLSAAVIAVLLASLAVVRDASRWPEAENPPLQAEAAIVSRDAVDPTHSPEALGRLIREPQNTWSNIMFVFGGAYLLSTSASRIARYTGIALIAVGAGSFFYHASASVALRHFDVAAMYWLYLMAVAV